MNRTEYIRKKTDESYIFDIVNEIFIIHLVMNASTTNIYISFVHTHTHTHIYIYIYRRYHTITDVYTTALLLTKPSSDDDSGFRHGFGAEASLPLAQRALAVSHDTTRLSQIIYIYIYIY